MSTITNRNASDATAAWLRRYEPATEGSPRRLVCFPHAGGSASFYRPLAARFAPDVEVFGVQYPGRQDRRHEPCVDDIGTLGELTAGCLRSLPQKPTVFFGHSMGAAVAFETAWRLEQSGHGPRALLASGRRAPSLRFDENIHQRDDAGVIAEIRAIGGTDVALLEDEDIVQMAMPSIRGDYRAIETYAADPDRRVSCPIIALIGDKDPKAGPDDVAAWDRHTTAAFRMAVLPGGHFYLIDQYAAVDDEIRSELDRWAVR